MSPLETCFLLTAGGALGTCARYFLGVRIAQRLGAGFPWGTFAINVSGSFVIGAFMAVASERLTLDPRWRLFIATGFCGGYTTFSTFAYETVQLASGKDWALAALNVGGSVFAGLLAVVAGALLARSLL
jgi:CrcB protein